MFDFLSQVFFYALLISFQLPIHEIAVSQENFQNKIFGPKKINEKSLGIELTAPYAVVVDKESGKILFEKKKDLQTPLASITKLASAMVYLDINPKLEGEIEFKKEDFRNGSQPYFLVGERALARDAFYASLIASSNEATIALARSSGLGEKEFIERMKNTAKKLGLTSTSFIDPTGLEPANISTAHEVSLLTKAAFSYKEIVTAVQKIDYSFQILNSKRRVKVYSTDKLLDSFINNSEHEYTLIGAKTGYINESKYNFTAEVKKKNNTILLVILGSRTQEDRWNEAKGLIDWTFKNFQWSEH